MIKVKEINWLNDSAKEAEVTISDGKFILTSYSQPFNYNVNDILDEPIYCYNVKNIMKSFEDGFALEKLNDVFAYFIRGELISNSQKSVRVSDFILILEDNLMPKDITDGDTIEFIVQRIDIY